MTRSSRRVLVSCVSALMMRSELWLVFLRSVAMCLARDRCVAVSEDMVVDHQGGLRVCLFLCLRLGMVPRVFVAASRIRFMSAVERMRACCLFVVDCLMGWRMGLSPLVTKGSSKLSRRSRKACLTDSSMRACLDKWSLSFREQTSLRRWGKRDSRNKMGKCLWR